MRISDWSSDVCSSDLVDADADHQPLQALRRICFGLQQNAGDFAAVQQNVVAPLVGDLEERRADGADRLAQGNRGDEAELRGFGHAARGPRDEGGEEVPFLALPLPALASAARTPAARPPPRPTLAPPP